MAENEVVTPVTETPVEAVTETPEIQLNVDPQTHMTITVQDYDRKIAAAEATVANLKKERVDYVYDTNVKILIAQAEQQKKEQETAEDTSEKPPEA